MNAYNLILPHHPCPSLILRNIPILFSAASMPKLLFSSPPSALFNVSFSASRLAPKFTELSFSARARPISPLVSASASARLYERRDSMEEGKTLGFHLSARFPFSDVVVRPASEQDVHWSLSGSPIFDERGRFLGFRGIGTDLQLNLKHLHRSHHPNRRTHRLASPRGHGS